MDHFVSLDEATHCCFGLGRFFMSVRAILAVRFFVFVRCKEKATPKHPPSQPRKLQANPSPRPNNRGKSLFGNVNFEALRSSFFTNLLRACLVIILGWRCLFLLPSLSLMM